MDVIATLTTRGRWVVQQESAEPFTLEEALELRVDSQGVEPLTANATFLFRPDPDSYVRNAGDNRPWHTPLDQQYDVMEVSAALSRVRTPGDALHFLRTYGPLSSTRLREIPTAPTSFREVIIARNGHDSFLLRNEPPVRSVVVGDAHAAKEFQDYWSYMANPPEIHGSVDNGLQGFMRCLDVLQALKAAVFLAKAEGLRWERCGRVRCSAPFAVTGKRTKYCSRQCANHQSVLDHYGNKGRKPKKLTFRETHE